MKAKEKRILPVCLWTILAIAILICGFLFSFPYIAILTVAVGLVFHALRYSPKFNYALGLLFRKMKLYKFALKKLLRAALLSKDQKINEKYIEVAKEKYGADLLVGTSVNMPYFELMRMPRIGLFFITYYKYSHLRVGDRTKIPTDLVVPELFNGVFIEGFDQDFLKDCDSVEKVTAWTSGMADMLPPSVKELHLVRLEYAYFSTRTTGFDEMGCDRLKSAAFKKGVKKINKQAFCDCKNLERVEIPESLTEIESLAFYNCDSLKYNEYGNALYLGNPENEYLFLVSATSKDVKTVTVNENAKVIDGYAFQNCKNLESVSIGKSVELIHEYAFVGNDNLKSLSVEEGNKVYHGKNNCIIQTATKTLVVGCKESVIPNDGSVTALGNSAFYKCSGLKSVTIPSSVQEIVGAFEGCENLRSVRIEEGVRTVGKNAFKYCNELTDVNIPDTAVEIGESAFESCYKLREIIIPNSVKSIGFSAFKNCNLTKIDLPDDLYSIGFETFRNCSFESVTIGNCVKYIYEDAFKGCQRLESVTIGDGVLSIDKGAFSECKNLKNVRIGKSVASVAQDAFNGCKNLNYNEKDDGFYLGNEDNEFHVLIGVADRDTESFTVAPTAKVIGTFAFKNCKRLREISIPDSVITVGSGAFDCCGSLTAVNLGKGVTCIDKDTFNSCSDLETVVIPESVTSIAFSAFHGCKALEKVYYLGAKRKWKKIKIGNLLNDAFIKAKKFYYSETKPKEKGDFWHYDGDGNAVEW